MKIKNNQTKKRRHFPRFVIAFLAFLDMGNKRKRRHFPRFVIAFWAFLDMGNKKELHKMVTKTPHPPHFRLDQRKILRKAAKRRSDEAAKRSGLV
jgi:hypothetical protein